LPNSLAERFTKQPALDLRRSHDEGQADRGEYRQAAGAVAEVIGIQNSECDKEGGRTRPGFGP
jgi:hypothetical protein